MKIKLVTPSASQDILSDLKYLPRKGDIILINKHYWSVMEVVFDFDKDEIRLQLINPKYLE